MPHKIAWTDAVRFYATLAALYLLTITFAAFVLQTWSPLAGTKGVAYIRAAQQPHLPSAPHVHVIAGRPVRIVIPSEGVDLPVDKGFYDNTDQSWTLSGYHAQFAMISTLANNIGGQTFIYGHNNDYVFGALRHHTPAAGATALLYTDNNHIFTYSFRSAASVGPQDTGVLTYSGRPVLLVQTCTGSLNEWRTEYTFDFSKVVQ